ncbi:sulfur carrier protein ThiS [Mangrovibrevibacter kandeliae]|uniref:sulfur carrier protein ThiS n=1 Tax=Mangrovibrevibacter kandeliae TaxID=2968473 RepID=UPI002118C8EB|nr:MULTISPECIES: sulfur carrier protein ThiS [unclassified Aurantimonas]MCQ8781196.1 sulfur carrier protein ThiS [Aurantimonas sp. CSK15Z-1]MCW4113973.1 sulfur carrier protein ThiS [Aurantimonas sp. MSK8Z-1]
MRILLNGKAAEIEAATLAMALAELGYDDRLVATALNRDFVPADERAATILNEGDRIEVLSPMQGG